MPKKEKEEPKQRIRIKVRAYDHKLIDQSVKQIVEIAERYGGVGNQVRNCFWLMEKCNK